MVAFREAKGRSFAERKATNTLSPFPRHAWFGRMPVERSIFPCGSRPMENVAFKRAARFLNYLPTAKWLSLICGVATAVLFLGLLLVLALYADLMVSQGAVS